MQFDYLIISHAKPRIGTYNLMEAYSYALAKNTKKKICLISPNEKNSFIISKIKKLNNLYFIYPSWTELLSKNFTDCYYESTFRTMSIYDALRKKLDWDYQSKAKWFEIEKAIKVKNKIWEESDYFSRRHPSDIGFVPMFDVIMKKI
jgi:hypothetical protein